ncbi:hypothetical protein ACHAWC_004196 [Mediolabrus comicus]
MIVDDGPIDTFIRTLSSLPAEEWQRRIGALQKLISSTPDYSTTYNPNNGDNGDGNGGTQQHDINAAVAAMTPSSRPHKFNSSSNSNSNNSNNNNTVIPWYHSSKSVRRLGPPLKTLLLDARSAVVKEATELIAILLCVKLQSHPSFTLLDNDDENNNDGRLLFKDLLQPLLQLSSQTVKVIRTYGNSLTLQVLPVCRVKSTIVILIERMKSDKNRIVREDCGRYLRCVLESWPGWVDDNDNDESGGGKDGNKNMNNNNINTRKDEQLSYECTQQIGLGIGRALTDPAQNVRNEAKRGFQLIFYKYRDVWNEVMNSGVIRDTRLRKNLLEAASRECGEDNNNGGGGGGLFDDMASLGDMSLNSGMSFTSMRSNMSYRSYASRGIGAAAAGGGGGGGGRAIPSVIGTPKVRKTSRYSPSTSTSSPSYMRSTAASSSSSPTKIHNKESSSTYSSSNYVLSSGHVVSSSTPQRTSRLPPPSPRNRPTSPSLSSPTKDRSSMTPPPKQPFASLMQTPQPDKKQTATTPTQQLRQYGNNNNIVNADSHHHNAKMLRKRLSRRISGIGGLETTSATSAGGGVGAKASANTVDAYKRQLSSIAEKSDGSVTTTVATSNGGSSPLSPSSPASTANNRVNSSSNSDEITFVALEVIAAHLAHLDKIETQISHEKDLLLDLNKQLGISISNATNSDELARCLGKLTEEQVCDYFESVHICVDLQRNASESLLREMERISQGGGGGGADVSMSSDTMGVSNGGMMSGLPQSPDGLDRLQRDLGAQF